MSQSLIEQFRQEDAANGYTPGQNVRPALEVAASTNADQQARSMQLAEELGLTREVVQEQSAWAEQEAKARRIERNPLFARWAEQSETNAAFARDDTEKMSDVFEILFDAERSAHNESGSQATADIVRGVLTYNARHGDKDALARLQAEDGLTEDEIRNGTISQTPMPGKLVQLGESYKEGWRNVAKSTAGFMALLGENMGKVVHTIGGEDAQPMWDALTRSARAALEHEQTAYSAPLNAGGYLNDFVRNLPQVAATVIASTLGTPAAGTAFMGSQIAGGTYADLTQQHEVRMPTAAELEEGARMVARAAAQGWQGAVNNARMAAHEAGGEGGALYEGEEPDELAMASARARVIAAAILNTEQATPAGAAALLSLGNAAIQAPLEMVGFGKMFDVFKATGAGNLVKRIVESAATEFVTETMQQHPDEFARIWGKGIAKGESFQDVWQKYTGQFWDITKEGMYAGALSAPFGLLGGIGKAATDVRMAKEAVDWAQAHIAFHAKVEETKAKQVAPALVQQALEEGGMRDMAHVDGEALYQLAQEDPQVLAQLGIEEKAVQQAAEAGQTITLPMSKVHARLQKEQLPKFMAIARREPESWTVQEADVLPETLKQTAERAAEEVATKAEAARLAEIEIRRIREEAIQAVSSVPTLMAKLQSDGTSPEAYVDNNLEIIVRQAKYLAEESGSTMAEALRDYTVEGLDYDPSGKLTPIYKLRDKESLEEERARAEAERPFWELVWGRVDPESLKTDYAETYKELRRTKRGLFMPAGRGGVPLDQIADELNERGIFTGSADDLLELLKTKERPRRGYYQEEGLSLQQQDSAVEVVFPNNGLVVGEVTPEMAETLHLNKPGRIVLNDKGVQHIEEEHGQQIRDLGFSGPQAFVEAVLENVTAVYAVKDNRRKYDLVSTVMQPQGRVMVRLEFDATGDFYSISTAGPLRKDYFKNKTPLWVKAQSSRSENSEPLGNPRAFTGQSSISGDSIAQAGEDVNSLYQTGWHGSGADFDAFDFSHMGEGEGHQVHGWGGYFAAAKDISDKRYRERLAKGSKFMVNGKRLSADDEQFLSYRLGGDTVYAAETSGDFTKLREEMRSLIDHYRNDRFLNNLIDVFQNQLERIDADPKLSITKFLEEVPSNEKYRFETIVQFARFKAKEEGHRASIADVRNQLVATMTPFVKQRDGNLQTAARLESFDIDNLEVYANQGQLFEVDIPEEEEMLNEQATFADQPEKVKIALEKMGFDDPARIFNWNENRFASPAEMKKLMADDWRLGEINKGNDPYNEFAPVNLMQGKLIYKYLKKKHRGAKPASLALLKHGVQGISYKGGIDGQAWVVFDDKKVQIVNKLYQRAFHGSPHRFIRFMLDHIGSGEGAQAHGWGLYFAQNRETAEGYRKQLTGGHSEYLIVDGRKYWLREGSSEAAWIDEETGRPAMFYDQDHLTRMYHKAKGAATDQDYLAAVEEWLQDDQYDAEQKDILRRQRDEYLNTQATIEQPGQVYEADVPENDVLLDEQKKLAEQPEKVKAALAKLGFIADQEEALRQYKELDKQADALEEQIENTAAPAERARLVAEHKALTSGRYQNLFVSAYRPYLFETGRDIYKLLVDNYEDISSNPEREASLALNEAGIKGITYDGRQDGRCFVIFDDQAIDMLDTYYQLAQGNTVVRGETVPAENFGGMGDVIRLFYHADLSTLTHESAHVFFLQMKRLVDAGRASERMKADYETLCQWVGSKDGYLTTSQHEVLARGMELFLREGKAPSKKLANAFARFRRWLTDIYKTVAGNPYFNVDGKQVELNPDVRRVFGRILATQEEVEAQAAEDVMGSDWTATLDRLGMTGAQRIAISGLIQDAKNYAETELYRQREADKKERLAKWRKEAAQQIESERVYRARTALRSRKGYGLDMLALANVVGNERALEFFKKLPGIKREGASPWAFAADFGYDSVEEFVDEVMAAPTKKERMAELMAAKEQEYDMQYRSESLLVAEETAKAQEMLHEHLIKLTGSRERGVPLEQLKSAASDIMATLPIEQATSVGKFRYQAKRLMRAQHEAIMRRDFGRALDITYKLRLNLELTVQAQKNKKEFDALTRDLARFTASKEPNPVVRYGVARLAMKHGLLAPTKMILRTEGDKTLNAVQDWFKVAQVHGYPVEFDADVWQAQLPTWRQMNSETFRRVYSQLKSMMTVERQMRHVDVQGKKMALDQYSQALGRHMLDNDPNRQDLGFAGEKSLVQATKDFLDPLSTVNARLKMYDNFKPLGMAWRAIMEPMNKAEAKRSQFFRKYAPMLQKLITSHYDAKRLVTMKDRKKVPGLKEAVSHEMCIMVGLNVGNAGNRLRLMNGFKNTKTMQDYGEAEVQAMLDQLDENDWRFIQEVWDFFEQFKKESFDMEERLTGVRPLEVQARPVPTRFGTFRGGYFPIAYDPDRGAKAANQQLAGGKNVMMPSVYHGMMKDRGDQGLGTPLDLRFSVITDKLAETGHNLAYREPVIEVAKLLRSHAVSRAIAATEGPVVELKFWRWLSALAGERPPRNSMDKVASWATSRMAIYAMGFKATTMIAQASGLLATSTQIGPRWTARGVRDTFNGGDLQKMKDMWQDTCARSPMMMDRLHSFDRDVYAMSKRLFETGHKNQALNLLKKTESWLTEHAFTLTGLVQLWMVDIPTWRGAFAKGMEELNMTEEEAALYADDMVVTAQGSGATKDMADIMREQGFMRVMTMFYSYFSAMYNMFMLQGAKTLRHPKEEWPYLASMAFVLWFIEPMLTGYATGRGPDDDEEWHEWFLLNGVKQPFQMVPIIRDLSGAWFNHIEGKFGSDYRFTPAADVIGAFEKTLEHGADLFTSDDYESRKKAAKRLARDVGMISGTPFLSSQAITTIGNMWDWLDGTEEFALRDLLFTRKK